MSKDKMDQVNLSNHIPVNLFVDTGKRASLLTDEKARPEDGLAFNMTAEQEAYVMNQGQGGRNQRSGSFMENRMQMIKMKELQMRTEQEGAQNN